MRCFHLQNGGYLVATDCNVMPRLSIVYTENQLKEILI